MYAETISQSWDGSNEWTIPGRFLRLIETVNQVDVSLFKFGIEVARAKGVEAGFFVRQDFDRVQIVTSADETVKFFLTDAEGGYDRLSASITQATARTGAGAKTIGTSETEILPERGNRKVIWMRADPSNTANIYLSYVAAGIALSAAAIVLEPGDMWTEVHAAPASWSAISDAAGQLLQVNYGL